MDADAIEYYQKNFGGVDRFISVAARRNVRADAVLEACQQVYAQERENPRLRRIQVGQRVLTLAQHLTVKAATAERGHIDELSEIARGIQQDHCNLRIDFDTLLARVAALEYRHRPFKQKFMDYLYYGPYHLFGGP